MLKSWQLWLGVLLALGCCVALLRYARSVSERDKAEAILLRFSHERLARCLFDSRPRNEWLVGAEARALKVPDRWWEDCVDSADDRFDAVRDEIDISNPLIAPFDKALSNFRFHGNLSGDKATATLYRSSAERVCREAWKLRLLHHRLLRHLGRKPAPSGPAPRCDLDELTLVPHQKAQTPGNKPAPLPEGAIARTLNAEGKWPAVLIRGRRQTVAARIDGVWKELGQTPTTMLAERVIMTPRGPVVVASREGRSAGHDFYFVFRGSGDGPIAVKPIPLNRKEAECEPWLSVDGSVRLLCQLREEERVVLNVYRLPAGAKKPMVERLGALASTASLRHCESEKALWLRWGSGIYGDGGQLFARRKGKGRWATVARQRGKGGIWCDGDQLIWLGTPPKEGGLWFASCTPERGCGRPVVLSARLYPWSFNISSRAKTLVIRSALDRAVVFERPTLDGFRAKYVVSVRCPVSCSSVSQWQLGDRLLDRFR